MKYTVGLKKARKISRKIYKLSSTGCSYKQIADKMQAKYGIHIGLVTIETAIVYHMQMEWLALQTIPDPDGVPGYKTINAPTDGYPCAACAVNCSDIDCKTVRCAPPERKDGKNVIFIKE